MRLKANQYQLINGVLFRKKYHSIFLRCLERSNVDIFLRDFHDEVAGEYSGDTTTHKNFHSGCTHLHSKMLDFSEYNKQG